MTRALLLASTCVVMLLSPAGCRHDDPVANAIRATASNAAAPPSIQGARWKLVQQVYRDREYRPLWMDGPKVRGQARDLIETLCHAEREGLRAADYDLVGLRTELEGLREAKEPSPAALAVLDLRLTRRFLDYGADLLAGRLDPQAVDNGWYISARRAAIDSMLRESVRSKNFDDMIAPLRPRRREYKKLVDALEKYRDLQGKGGWSLVPADKKLVRGDEGASVGALRNRLQVTGELRRAAGKPVFNEDVAAAVARFQERHGLPVDSSAGPATLAALNVPVETRIRQIELNLERYRWLPSDFGKRYILVNIPDYRLYAYHKGKEALTMRVIVGDEYGNATPVFADSMTYVVFRPQWDMPRRILVDEVIPKVRENIYYLAQHGYEVVDTVRNEVVTDPAAINWSDLDTTNIHFRVRQKAGTGNALGNVKFMFPNQFSIYLHDTPAEHLFERQERTLSHGCVRVEDPVKLAGYVLSRQGGWDEDKIKEAMQPADSGSVEPVPVDLKEPIPVYLVYLTAFVRDGVLQFRDDPYRKGCSRDEHDGQAGATRALRVQGARGARRGMTMRLALAAALLGVIPLSITAHYRGPAPAEDPHDTLAAAPDSAPSLRSGQDLVPTAPVRVAPGGRVSFAVKFKEEVSPFPVLAMFVMPGEQVPLEAVFTDSTVRYTAEAGGGRLARLGPSRWRWTAPKEKGLFPIWVRDSVSGETVTLNAFVLVPMPTAATIGEFMVGSYESRPFRGDPNYARPAGFVEVTETNRGTLVAPHFTVGQFVSKQGRGFPTYLVLRERLLLKLEMLLEEVRSAGLPASTFRILSGYRTPFYNRSIGNETRYSRHVYGDAADIYVDEDGDGRMDDLDGDGRTTLDDARALAAVVEGHSEKSWYQPFEGGLGLYRANAAHGPFVHVDVRGHPARWGP